MVAYHGTTVGNIDHPLSGFVKEKFPAYWEEALRTLYGYCIKCGSSPRASHSKIFYNLLSPFTVL